MSRIGKKIIIVPEGVNVDVAADNTVTVTGPKGTLTRKFSDLITIEVNGNEIECKRHSEEKVSKQLVMNIGYSHPVEVEIEEGVKVECPSATEITVSGISKERVGHVASVIRAWKKPEPYKGKGIKYSDEHIIRKEGKTAGKK